MSIALNNNHVKQIPNGFLHRSKISPYNISPILDSGDRTVMRVVVKKEEENGHKLDHSSNSCSSSSSSIGINSDDDDEEIEVQSKLKNTPFDSAVDALEQALPIRRGISKFYNGKSKSFASLTNGACSSIEEITKPENAYSRKRKNLLAYKMLYDKGRTSLVKSHGIGGGIAKRPTYSSRSTLALAVAINNHETSIDENELMSESNRRINKENLPISPPLSPLPPHPWRSFSVVDLQHCSVSASVVKCNLSSPVMGKRTNSDEVS